MSPGGVDRTGTERVIPCLLWLIERLVAAGDDVHVFAFAQEEAPATWPLLGATVHNAGGRSASQRMKSVLALFVREQLIRRFDAIHAFWAVPSGVAGTICSWLTGAPLLVTLPGGDAVSYPLIGYGGRLTWRGRALFRLGVAGAAIVTVQSKAMQKALRALHVDARQVELGVALDRWPVRAPVARRAAGPLRLLHVASLNAVKDQPTLLEAAKRLQRYGVDFELDVIGFDTLDGAIQRLARETGLAARIRFHGFLPHREMRRFFDATHLLVVSSIHDAGPLVVLEAAIAGIPTVGTAVGHVADFAPEAAIAVPCRDGRALAAALYHLASHEDERLRLARAAQARTIVCDADYTSATFRSLYAEMARRPRARFNPVGPRSDALTSFLEQ